jgi:FkbM family methyltransferase
MKLNGLLKDVKTGMYYRPNTIDKMVIAEVINRNTYAQLVKALTPEDTVLDLGGHIGSFVNLVALKAKKVICYEPHPENFQLLELNTKRFSNVEIHEKAVTGRDGDKIEFWYITKPRGNNKNTGAGGIYEKRGRSMVMVDNIHILDILLERGITKIKCDTEGAEYELFSNIKIPESVDGIIFEIHVQGVKGAKKSYSILENNFLSQKFRVHKPENLFRNKSWYYTVYFERLNKGGDKDGNK